MSLTWNVTVDLDARARRAADFAIQMVKNRGDEIANGNVIAQCESAIEIYETFKCVNDELTIAALRQVIAALASPVTEQRRSAK